MDDTRGNTHTLIRDAKDQHNVGATAVLAAAWSAYWHTHGERIAGPETLVVRVPSRNPLLDRLTAHATAEGWPVPTLHAGGPPRTFAGRGATRAERMAANANDSRVELAVRDRDVALVDDVYTTGATAWTFGAALRKAGGRHLRLVVLERCVAAGPLLALAPRRWDAGIRRTTGSSQRTRSSRPAGPTEDSRPCRYISTAVDGRGTPKAPRVGALTTLEFLVSAAE